MAADRVMQVDEVYPHYQPHGELSGHRISPVHGDGVKWGLLNPRAGRGHGRIWNLVVSFHVECWSVGAHLNSDFVIDHKANVDWQVDGAAWVLV